MLNNKFVKNIIRTSIFLIILIILFFRLRDENFKEYIILFLNYKFVFNTFLILSILSVISILRWKIILQTISNKNIFFRDLFKPAYYSYLSDQINVLGFFASRTVYIPKNINISTSIFSSLIEKISSFFTKAIFCIPGVLFIYLSIENFNIKTYLNILIILSFFCIIILIFIFFNRIASYLRNIYAKYNFYSNFTKSKVSLLILYSFLIQIVILNLTFYIHIHLNNNLSYTVFYLLASVSFFVSSMPISVSQWGLREVSFFIVFSSFVEGNELIITSLIYGFTVLFYFLFCNCTILISDLTLNLFQFIKKK
tara:strand:- start:783 stop:1715 length:933 start_codon:yes stop_codon:yes gene_type:complete